MGVFMLDSIVYALGYDSIKLARPMSQAMMIVSAIAVIAWSAYLYRGSVQLKAWIRLCLGAARIVVLGLIIFALMEPMGVVDETRSYPRRLPVLIDSSQSMSIQDPRKEPADIIEAAIALDMLPVAAAANDNQAVLDLSPEQRRKIASSSRHDLAKAVLAGVANGPLSVLSDRMDVGVYSFGSHLQWLGGSEVLAAGGLDSLHPDAGMTTISESLEAISSSQHDAAPAGIIILTDGIENTSSPRSDAVLHELGTRGVPVYPVAVGLPDPDDVSIRNIVMQDVAFSGDSAPVRVQIKSRGYEKRSAMLSVMLNDRRVAQKKVVLKGGLQFEDIVFRVDVHNKGAARVDVVIDHFDDEVSVANNRVQRSIRVVNEKVNVLYIEGSARWEFRYLQAILKRDPRINATFITSSLGPEMARNSQEYIERFPSRAEEAFLYDLVILGDVDPAFFSDEELAMLERLIRDRGASLIVLCGAEFTPTAYKDTVVESLLPVTFDPDLDWEEVAQSVYPVLTPEGLSSMVMTLEETPEANERVWSRMAPLDWVAPLLEPKLGATVLVGLSDTGERSAPYPLVAWQRYGTGKCMSIATDRLWRLRFKAGDKYHWRVWSQCIQFMTLSRLMGEHKQIRLETDRAAYATGDQVRLYAHVLSDDYQPLQQSRFNVNIVGVGDLNSDLAVSLGPVQGNPGLYEGYFSPPAPGRYRMQANADDQSVANTIEFQVAGVKQELQETGARRDHLQRIADLSGGRLLSMADLSDLTKLVDSEPITTTVHLERPLWDNWFMALLLIGLAGTEWLVRRRHDLP
jgi:hypothetical protein